MIYVGRVRVSVFRMFIFCFYYVCICACVYASVQLIPLFYAAIYNCACLFSIQFMWVFFFFLETIILAFPSLRERDLIMTADATRSREFIDQKSVIDQIKEKRKI